MDRIKFDTKSKIAESVVNYAGVYYKNLLFCKEHEELENPKDNAILTILLLILSESGADVTGLGTEWVKSYHNQTEEKPNLSVDHQR